MGTNSTKSMWRWPDMKRSEAMKLVSAAVDAAEDAYKAIEEATGASTEIIGSFIYREMPHWLLFNAGQPEPEWDEEVA